MATQIMVASNSFVFEHGGVMVHVPKGTTVRVGHPLLKGREGKFRELVIDYDIEHTKPKPTKVVEK